MKTGLFGKLLTVAFALAGLWYVANIVWEKSSERAQAWSIEVKEENICRSFLNIDRKHNLCWVSGVHIVAFIDCKIVQICMEESK